MAQYKTGTVAVTNGSGTVTGTATLFVANVTVGDIFTVVGDNTFYQVASVTSNTVLVLTANYAGLTASGKAYTIARDFTTNLGFPVPNQGDIETAAVVKRAIEEIDAELNTAGIGGDGREWIDLKDTPTFVNATQFTVAGDKTANYHADRRIRCTDATTLYGRITAASFAASVTTVTVALDSGSLSASLSKVAVGVASATTPAITGSGVKGGTPLVDAIDEYTTAAGVTIDGALIKDGLVTTGTPTAGTHAANKSYVDGLVVSGVFWKQPVRVATTANVTLSGEQTIDGVLTSVDRILVKDQTTGSENGIYVMAAGAWARAADADTDAEVIAGIAAWVNEGTANADSAWVLTTDDPIVVATTALTFTKFSSSGGTVTAVTGTAPITSTGGNTPDIAITAETGGAAGSMSAADKTKLDAIEAAADVTDATNVNAAGAVMEADFNASTILAADTDDTPAALTIAASTIVGRKATGGIVALTTAETRTIINVADGANAYVHPSHTGDVTSTGDGATVIATNAVTLAKMADMATASFLGRNTAATGDPEVLSATTARSILNVENGATADQSNAEIKTAYEANADTNEFSDAEQTKLAGIETAADVTDDANVRAALAAATADIAVNSQKITGVADPAAGQDAATKAYVDAAAVGIDWKAPVRVATTANVTLSGEQTIDGVATSADRILVKAQTAGSENGIYVTAAGAWSRATDADVDAEVKAGLAVFVEEGTANADTGWLLTTDNPITVGTTALTFTQFTSLGQITAGAGLTKTGGTIDAVANGDGSITVNADDIQVGVLASDAQHGVRGGGTQHADVIAGGAAGSMSAADKTKLDAIEAAADVTDATNVNAAGAVMEADFNASTILAADTDDTPAALTIAASTIVGRKATGGIVALTTAETRTIINVADGANAYVHPSHTGDVTSTGDGATVIATNAVTLAKMADMATASFLGRNTAATGDPEVLSATTARSILNVENGATADQSNAEIKTAYEANADTNEFSDAEQTKLAGIETAADVTDATNVNAAGAVMEADFNASTILAADTDDTPSALTIAASTMESVGRKATGGIVALTAAETRTIINVADGANAYVHPNHTGDVTSTGDGATVIAANAVTLAKMADMATASFLGRNAAASGDPEVLSATTARSILNVENGATADQSNAEIKTAYEANAGTPTNSATPNKPSWPASRPRPT